MAINRILTPTWRGEASELLHKEIELCLSPLSEAANLYDIVTEVLTKPRPPLADEDNFRWSLIPLVVSDAISGHYKRAIPLAVAIRCFSAAADVFDDIEDADSSDSLVARHGRAVATNVATTLVVLGEKAITRLQDRGIAEPIIVNILNALNTYCLNACAGQHLDLRAKPGNDLSEETYLRIATAKSGSPVACAFCVGALSAGGQPDLVSLFSEFGSNLGVAAQIANDIRGIVDGNDVRQRKITLPVVYALAQRDSRFHPPLEAAFSTQSSTFNPDQIRDLLFSIGGVHYATLKLELYKQHTLDLLARIEAAGVPTDNLKSFLV